MIRKVVKPGPKFDPNDVTVQQIKKMIDSYKAHPGGGTNTNGPCGLTRFAHFPISQIVKLLVDNGVVTRDQTVEDLLNNKANGIKMYFCQHVDKDDCPPSPPEYLGYNTAVVVATVINTDKKWDDLLATDKNSVMMMDSGQGTDKANLCPPQCALFGTTL